MTETKPSTADQADRSDSPPDGWIDRYMPAWIRGYLKLARVDRPIGTWLLFWPCVWSALLAAATTGHAPPAGAILLFGVGAFVMRGAGCTYNDIIDRDFDAKVARTAARPIPAGAVSVRGAAVFLVLQLMCGLTVLVQFNGLTIAVGFGSMVLVLTYPFMKRITYWPQAWLGLTFNWGALVGWTAVTGSFAWTALAVYAAGFFWTLGYDTIYAHQDKEDDALVGVKSSALALGGQTVPFVIGCYTAAIALLALAIGLTTFSWAAMALLLAAAFHMTWQVASLDIDDAANCLARFKSNRDTGLLIAAAMYAAIVY